MHQFIRNSVGTGLLAATLLCGCGAMPRSAATGAPPQHRRLQPRAEIPARALGVGVLIAGWHTGLILPARELGALRSLLPVYPGERYVSFGWGNRRFYMSPDPSVYAALAALFRSPSAVLVEGAPTVRDLLPVASTYRWLCADRQEVVRIEAYLLDSLRERGGRAIVLGAGPAPESEFLASGERYDAFNTCNTWTAAALQRAGLPISAGGVIFAVQLKDRVRKLPECTRSVGGGHGPVAGSGWPRGGWFSGQPKKSRQRLAF